MIVGIKERWDMHVIGFTALVGAGWYSEVQEEVSYEEFIAKCKFSGIASGEEGEEEEEEFDEESTENLIYTWDDIQVVAYDDEIGVMEFHFDEPKLYLEVPPVLRNGANFKSSIQLVIKEGN